MSAESFKLKAQKYSNLNNNRRKTRSALWASWLPPTDNGELWLLPYCVSAVYQNKTKWRSKQKSKTNLFTIETMLTCSLGSGQFKWKYQSPSTLSFTLLNFLVNPIQNGEGGGGCLRPFKECLPNVANFTKIYWRTR